MPHEPTAFPADLKDETKAADAATAATYTLASIDPTDLDSRPATAPATAAPIAPATALVTWFPFPCRCMPQSGRLCRRHRHNGCIYKNERAQAERCLAQAIYFEAGDQPYRGQVSVAQVMMNRVFSPHYPNDVCAVVYQNAYHYRACQFTFACDGKPETVTD